MKDCKKHRVWIRRVLSVILIFLMVLAVECWDNRHAIKGGYEMLDVSENISLIEQDGVEKYCISYFFSKSTYAREIHICGQVKKTIEVQIDTVEINSYGVEEKKHYWDVFNYQFDKAITPIHAGLKELRIYLSKENVKELTAVYLTNKFVWNRYRMLLLVLALGLLYCVFFEKWFQEREERIFLLIAVPFGVLLILYTQTQRTSWDEQIHFRNAYQIACGKNVIWSEAAFETRLAEVPECNTKEECAMARNYLDAVAQDYVYEEAQDSVLTYSRIAYIPQALFLKIGILMNLPYTWLYMLGKFGNFLVYLIGMYLAIRHVRYKRLLILFFALTPTVIFQAASYTYDNVVTTFLTLGTVFWANHQFDENQTFDSKCYIGMFLLFVVGSLSKAVYIPMLLLMLMLPQFRLNDKKKTAAILIGIALLFLLIMVTFVLPTITNTMARNVSFGGDSRGGDTSTVRQLISMIKHPLSSIKLMIGSIFSFDNFRNLGYEGADNYLFSNLMFLNFALAGILADKWSLLLIPLLVVLLIYNDAEEIKCRYSLLVRVGMLTVFFMTVGLIWLALYLSFTPVGSTTIQGVQARYYLPLVYFFALIINTTRIKMIMNRNALLKITSCATLIFLSMTIYQCLVAGRLMS